MRETLRISLLGAPQFHIGDRRITGWPSRAAEAAIAYVVSNTIPTPRSKLVDLLWPDSDPKQAQANLRTILSKIRQQLGDYFIIDRLNVAIKPNAPVTVDSLDLTRAITPDASITQLTHAVALYRDSFLAGLELRNAYPFDEWLTIQREQLERLTITALQRLASTQLRNGSYALGERYAQRWSTLDQFSEDAVRTLMWLQLRLGRRNEALRRYESFRQLLEAELGIEPVEATQAVAARAQQVTQLGSNNLRPAHTAFVERQPELNTLLTRIRQPEARLITLLGTGGTGKTRLAQAVAETILQQQRGLFLDGVWLVGLATVSTGKGLMRAIAETLGIRSRGGQSVTEALHAYLGERELLLVIDNFEQLVDDVVAIDNLAELLQAAPAVKLLVTSRRRLHLYEEVVVDLS